MVRAAALISMLVLSSPIVAKSWPIGVEQEVDAGVYMTLFSAQQGWRVWLVDTKDSSKCSAIKSAVGRPHPEPVGINAIIFGGTPFLRVSRDDHGLASYSWSGRHYGKVTVKLREKGERYWSESGSLSPNLDRYDGKLVSLSVSSWEYPELWLGHDTETGEFNFVGLKEALRMVDVCTQAVEAHRTQP